MVGTRDVQLTAICSSVGCMHGFPVKLFMCVYLCAQFRQSAPAPRVLAVMIARSGVCKVVAYMNTIRLMRRLLRKYSNRLYGLRTKYQDEIYV
jgi:hypothetical protein